MTGLFKTIALGVALGLSTLSFGSWTNPDRDCDPTADVKIVNATYDLDDDGESEISGRISNISDDDEYSSVQLRLNFFDDDGEQLGSETVRLNSNLNEGETEDFVLKFHAPEDAESLTYEVVCAVEE